MGGYYTSNGSNGGQALSVNSQFTDVLVHYLQWQRDMQALSLLEEFRANS